MKFFRRTAKPRNRSLLRLLRKQPRRLVHSTSCRWMNWPSNSSGNSTPYKIIEIRWTYMHQASSEKPEAQDYRALIKNALLEIERMEAKLQEAERSRSAPIAVIGVGCRFPGGANNPESYWNNLCEGVDVISEAPPERWNMEDYRSSGLDDRERSFCRYAGFLDQ